MINVGDIMTHDVVCIEEKSTLQEAIDLMDLRGCRHLVVINEDAKVSGIVSDRDCRLAQYSPYIVRERWQDEAVLNQTEVGMIMTPEPICVTPHTLLPEAAQKMLTYHINALVVMNKSELVGILTSSDVMRAYVQESQFMNAKD